MVQRVLHLQPMLDGEEARLRMDFKCWFWRYMCVMLQRGNLVQGGTQKHNGGEGYRGVERVTAMVFEGSLAEMVGSDGNINR